MADRAVQELAVAAVTETGGCGNISPDGDRICILTSGHLEPHPWDDVAPVLAALIRRGMLKETTHNHLLSGDPTLIREAIRLSLVETP